MRITEHVPRIVSVAGLMAVPTLRLGEGAGANWWVSALGALVLATASTLGGVALSKSSRFRQAVRDFGPEPHRLVFMATKRLLMEFWGPGRLTTPPGSSLGQWLRVVFGTRVYERLLEQHLVDHSEDWLTAHARGELLAARWIRIRCWIVLLWTVLGALPLDQIRSLLLGGSISNKPANGE